MSTMRCEPDISPDCPGHESWQRFTDCQTEALFMSTADDQTGDVDGFEIHVSLFIQTMDETLDHPTDAGHDIKVTIPKGTFCLLISNEQGHVTRLDYDSAEKAQNAFDLWESKYSDYLDACEMRELSITSNTGRIGR